MINGIQPPHPSLFNNKRGTLYTLPPSMFRQVWITAAVAQHSASCSISVLSMHSESSDYYFTQSLTQSHSLSPFTFVYRVRVQNKYLRYIRVIQKQCHPTSVCSFGNELWAFAAALSRIVSRGSMISEAALSPHMPKSVFRSREAFLVGLSGGFHAQQRFDRPNRWQCMVHA